MLPEPEFVTEVSVKLPPVILIPLVPDAFKFDSVTVPPLITIVPSPVLTVVCVIEPLLVKVPDSVKSESTIPPVVIVTSV